MLPAIILFKDQHSEPEFDTPRPERRIRGIPQRTTWSHYSNDSGEVYSGVWACEPGSWRVEMGAREDEFFFVIEGRCRLLADDGRAWECAAGESLVIPAGFSGTFEVIEPMRKHYMIVDRKA